MKFEDETVDRVVLQMKGGLLEFDEIISMGDQVSFLVTGTVVSVEHKINQRTGHLQRHQIVKYDSVSRIPEEPSGTRNRLSSSQYSVRGIGDDSPLHRE